MDINQFLQHIKNTLKANRNINPTKQAIQNSLPILNPITQKIGRTAFEQYLFNSQTKTVLPNAMWQPDSTDAIEQLSRTARVTPKSLDKLMPLLFMTTSPSALRGTKPPTKIEQQIEDVKPPPGSFPKGWKGTPIEEFDDVTKGRISDIKPVGGVDEYTASLQKMKAEGRPLMLEEEQWLKGDYSSIEPQAKKLYGVTKNPNQSLYIAKDGQLIGNKGIGSAEHKDYSMELTGQMTDTSLLPKRSGFIEQIYAPGSEYNLRIFTEPTPEQIATIKKVSQTVPVIYIDDYRGRTVKSHTLNKNQVNNFFTGVEGEIGGVKKKILKEFEIKNLLKDYLK